MYYLEMYESDLFLKHRVLIININVLMATKCLNTRSLGSLCPHCDVQDTINIDSL